MIRFIAQCSTEKTTLNRCPTLRAELRWSQNGTCRLLRPGRSQRLPHLLPSRPTEAVATALHLASAAKIQHQKTVCQTETARDNSGQNGRRSRVRSSRVV